MLDEKWYYCDNCKRWEHIVPQNMSTNADVRCPACGNKLSCQDSIECTQINDIEVGLTEEEKDYLKMLFEMGDVVMNHIDNNNGYYNLSFDRNDVFRLKEKLGLV